jgi:hypothetical protein
MIVKVEAHAPLSCDSVKCQCWPARVLYVQRSARLTAEVNRGSRGKVLGVECGSLATDGDEDEKEYRS